MPLNDFPSGCGPHASPIVSRDKGSRSTHVGENRNGAHVTHYRIDGNVITQGKRCDFLLINEDARTAYLIELKGSDLSTAAEQLEETQRRLARDLAEYDLRYRIVANKCRAHQIQGGKFQKFRRKHGSKLRLGSGRMTEEI